MSLHTGNVVSEASVGNISADAARNIGRSPCHRRNGLARKCCSVSCRHTAEHTSDKADGSTGTHTDAALNNRITNKGIPFEFAGKACRKSGRSSCCRCCAGCTPKDAASITESATHACNNSCSHEKLHTHTGACLRHIKTDRAEIGIKLLRRFQKRQRTEQPKENASLSIRKCPAVSDVISDRRIEASQKPDIHNKEQQL